MDKKRAVVKVTVYAVISDILRYILTHGGCDIMHKRHFQTKELKGLFIINDELIQLRNIDDVVYHFQISAIGNPTRYPVDILEVIYRSGGLARSGIYIRFRGGEIPITLTPNILVMNDAAIHALVDVIVDSNEELINLINQSSGGKHAAKRSGQ